MSSYLISPKPMSLLNKADIPDVLLNPIDPERQLSLANQGLEIQDDLDLVRSWIRSNTTNRNTSSSYQREAERALLFSWVNKGKPLTKLMQDDWLDYMRFLAEPLPAAQWCGPSRPRNHPNWKPFRRGLSDASRHQSLTVLNGLFTYAVDIGYLQHNPLKRLPFGNLKTKKHSDTVERYLPEATLNLLFSSLQNPSFTNKLREKGGKRTLDLRIARLHFILDVLYHTAARLSDLCNASQSDWQFLPDQGYWVWQIEQGKGNKSARIPLANHLVQHREDFYQKLAPDTQALIPNLSGNKPVSTRMLQIEISLAGQIASELVPILHPDMSDAERDYHQKQLSSLSPHWLRHTAISHLVKSGQDLNTVQHFARHASLTTTQRYLHTEESHAHKSLLSKLNRTRVARQAYEKD